MMRPQTFPTRGMNEIPLSQALCEQLAERLEKEKFDIRSALVRWAERERYLY